MSPIVAVVTDHVARRAELLIWPVALWPDGDRQLWIRNRLGTGLEGRDNPAVGWCERTLKNSEAGYGRYLSWLSRENLLIEDEPVTTRIVPERLDRYTAALRTHLSPVSVGMTIGTLCAAARALRPNADWSWVSCRATRLKLKAKPSREKRHAVRHTLDLYRFGTSLMDTADRGKGMKVGPAQRYQSGLVIALLAARPLRIRNFEAITIGESLRWDGGSYWLTFGTADTKMHTPIDEPLPEDLTSYLETFLRTWRPVLLHQARKYAGIPTHRRLWVDRTGKPMTEANLRELIKRYTQKEFGTAVWPHLFRDCLLTSVAVDQPDLMRVSASLLGHSSAGTGEKHYNQARMLDASRRYGSTISELRQALLTAPEKDREAGELVTGAGDKQ